MDLLSSLLIGKPGHILAVGGVFLAGHFLLRMTGFGSNRHPRALLVVAAAWAIYAAWEWLVVTFSPEANIRVDLMLIWPVVLILSIWFTVRAFR
jgi:hypothetical protein